MALERIRKIISNILRNARWLFCASFYIVSLILLIIMVWPVFLSCNENKSSIELNNQFCHKPYFLGSLLGLTPINMKPGHPGIEPTLKIISSYGKYDSNWRVHAEAVEWSASPLVDFQFGFTERIGFETIASFTSSYKKNAHSTHMEDTHFFLGFQVANDSPNSWTPDFRINIQETVPTGKYQKLDPKKLGTDETGEGPFQTGLNFIAQKQFALTDSFLKLKGSIGFLFPHSVKLKGLNAYGGWVHTRGSVKPGNKLSVYFSGEYSLTQNWIFAFDTLCNIQASSRFSGRKGIGPDGKVPAVGKSPNIQISFAPQIEYNLSPSFGFNTGIWLTIFGKNTEAFASGFGAMIYVF